MEFPRFLRLTSRAAAFAIAALACGCDGRKRTAADAAGEMARHFTEQRFAEAYQQASTEFRFTKTANYFEARVRDLGLSEARGVKWGEPETNGGLSSVRGVFTLKDGREVTLTFTFNMEGGDWRLIEARSEPAGGRRGEDVFAVAWRTRDTMEAKATEIQEPSAPDIPSEPQLRQLVEDTLLLFNEAIQNEGDFAALFAAASDRWKLRGRTKEEINYLGSDPERRRKADPENNEHRLTMAALRNAFSAHVAAKIDLSPIRGHKMILSNPPRVNSDGVLILAGTFDANVSMGALPGQPRKLEFSLEYVHEAGTWKLFGLTVNVAAPTNAAVSPR